MIGVKNGHFSSVETIRLPLGNALQEYSSVSDAVHVRECTLVFILLACLVDNGNTFIGNTVSKVGGLNTSAASEWFSLPQRCWTIFFISKMNSKGPATSKRMRMRTWQTWHPDPFRALRSVPLHFSKGFILHLTLKFTFSALRRLCFPQSKFAWFSSNCLRSKREIPPEKERCSVFVPPCLCRLAGFAGIWST